MLFIDIRNNCIKAGEERESLIIAQTAEQAKIHQLRTKAKLITEELLKEQKSKEFQHELIAAKEDLSTIRSNFTANVLRVQF